MQNIKTLLDSIEYFITYGVPVIALYLQIKSEKNYSNELDNYQKNNNILNIQNSFNSNTGLISITNNQNIKSNPIKEEYIEKFNNSSKIAKKSLIYILLLILIKNIYDYSPLNWHEILSNDFSTITTILISQFLSPILMNSSRDYMYFVFIIGIIYSIKPAIFNIKNIFRNYYYIILSISLLLVSNLNFDEVINKLSYLPYISTIFTNGIIYLFISIFYFIISTNILFYFIDKFYNLLPFKYLNNILGNIGMLLLSLSPIIIKYLLIFILP